MRCNLKFIKLYVEARRCPKERDGKGAGGQGSSTKELLLISVADGTQLAGDRFVL